jgi:putative NIF3 family GTP cyclohydrolase 1 type 2
VLGKGGGWSRKNHRVGAEERSDYRRHHWCSGSEIERVAAEGIETFITGEAPHWAAIAAEELGVNLLLAGHYATETFGVKALAAHLAKKFPLGWEFISLPTGL